MNIHQKGNRKLIVSRFDYKYSIEEMNHNMSLMFT